MTDYEIGLKKHKGEAMIVIRDMYGVNTDKYKILRERLERANTHAEINNALSYGRLNLL